MGRSVMTLPDSIVAYQTFEPDETFYREIYNEDIADGIIDPGDDFDDFMHRRFELDAEYEFGALIEWVQSTAKELWPSMEDADDWVGDELHVIAQNAHSVITISEYCGMVAICLGANYDRHEYWRDPSPTLGEHWRNQVSERFLATFSEYQKIGTFSNGESVYQKKGA